MEAAAIIGSSYSKMRDEIKAKMELTSFQRNEALVLTDNSDKYAEWPNVSASKRHDILHKISSTAIGSQVKKSVGKVAVQPTPEIQSTSRAPLVQQRAAVLRNSRIITESTSTSTSAAALLFSPVEAPSNERNPSGIIPGNTIPINDFKRLSVSERERSQTGSHTGSYTGLQAETLAENNKFSQQQVQDNNSAMTLLLQQAEGLLMQVNTVRGYTNQKSYGTSPGKQKTKIQRNDNETQNTF